ncbi:MAG: protein kinase, partial [Nanoarchaeota archaeon]|nr:protein kinase [Nanoarchaeota archaeon]
NLGLEGVINLVDNTSPILWSSRYDILEESGRGWYGVVYKVRDKVADDICAIKVSHQTLAAKNAMEYRKKDLLESIKKEGRRRADKSRVSASIEYEDIDIGDNENNPFLVMDYFPSSLRNIVNNKKKFGMKVGLDEILKFALGAAKTLARTHSKGQVHMDVKPENFLLDEDSEVWLGDFGNATEYSPYHLGPRDNIGHFDYKAPEIYKKGYVPNASADIFSLGVVIYEMCTGETLGKTDELNEDIVEQKLKNVPRYLRKFLRKILDMDEWKRTPYRVDVVKNLEEIIEKQNFRKVFKSYNRKFTLPISAGLGGLALLVLALAHSDRVKVDIPEVKFDGVYMLEHSLGKEPVYLDIEDGIELPKAYSGMLTLPQPSHYLRMVSENVNVRFLYSTYSRAFISDGARRGLQISNEIQWRTVKANFPAEMRYMFERGMGVPNEVLVAGKSIEVALSASKKPNGKVDFEDLCVRARLGDKIWNDAKYASGGSSNYRDYVKAKDSEGNLIIPEKERFFIEQWMAQTLQLNHLKL